MSTIYKYPLTQPGELRLEGVVVVDLPRAATLLSVQVQHEAVVLWVLCDPGRGLLSRRFRFVATGNELPPSPNGFPPRHLATLQVQYGLVVHVFEEDPPV